MGEASAIAGAVVAALFVLAGALGAWRWYRVETSRAFWVLLRVAQAALVGYVVLVGVLLATGRRPDDDLFYIYALLPVGVSFVAARCRQVGADRVHERAQLLGAVDRVLFSRREIGARPSTTTSSASSHAATPGPSAP